MYPRKTATYRACEQASMNGLPISRTTGGAKHTRRWKAARSWWDPAQVPKIRKIRRSK